MLNSTSITYYIYGLYLHYVGRHMAKGNICIHKILIVIKNYWLGVKGGLMIGQFGF